MAAVVVAAFEVGDDLDVVAVGEGGFEGVEFVFEFGEGAENFVAVLFEYGAPELRIAGGDAGGVAEAAAGVVAPVGILVGEEGAEGGGEDLGEVADVCDDFVVGVGGDGDGLGAEIAPEAGDGFGGGGGGLGKRGDETGAVVEEIGRAVFPTGFFGAGHGMGADEVSAAGEGGVAETGDFAFDAADVGDDGAGREVRGDLAGEIDDAIDGGGDDDEGGVADGGFGGVGDVIAPRLFAEGDAGFGTAGPDGDAIGDAVGAGGACDGSTEEARSEDGEGGGHDGERGRREESGARGGVESRRTRRNPAAAPGTKGRMVYRLAGLGRAF